MNSHPHRTYPPADAQWATSRGCMKFNHSVGRCEGKKIFEKDNKNRHAFRESQLTTGLGAASARALS